MAKHKGIDISQWQGTIDFTKVKAAGIDFAILRTGYSTTIDNRFKEYVKGCRNAGIPVKGVYHFSYALNADQARQEAVFCLTLVRQAGLSKDTVIFYDFEYDTVAKAQTKGVKLGADQCQTFTKAFCDYIQSQGYKAGIYCNNDYRKNMYKGKLIDDYVFWLADYTGEPDHPCAFQQYTSGGKVDGIRGNVDLDYCFCEKSAKSEDKTSGNEVKMTRKEFATKWMETIAADNSHGYDQRYRWGERGDYDCSSAVITAWELAGVPVKTKGATYTGNMYNVFKSCGFRDVTASVNLATGSGLQRGDVLLNHVNHVAMYVGNGKEVEASINERGGVTGGTPGDQTGKEFLVKAYRNYPWNCVLRYPENETTVNAGKKKTVAEIAKEVLAGKWGNGSDRKNRLTAAGYNYSEVQAAVNAQLKGTAKKDVTAVAREVISGKWGNGATRKANLERAGYNYAEVQRKVNELLR